MSTERDRTTSVAMDRELPPDLTTLPGLRFSRISADGSTDDSFLQYQMKSIDRLVLRPVSEEIPPIFKSVLLLEQESPAERKGTFVEPVNKPTTRTLLPYEWLLRFMGRSVTILRDIERRWETFVQANKIRFVQMGAGCQPPNSFTLSKITLRGRPCPNQVGDTT